MFSNRIAKLILTISFVLIATCSFSQSYLHVNHKRTYLYKQGDEITISFDGRKTSGMIAFFTDSSMFFEDRREIPVSKIEVIYRKNPRKRGISNIYIAALVLPLVDIANNGSPVDNDVLKISSALITSALIIQFLHRRKLKIRYPGQLRIIE